MSGYLGQTPGQGQIQYFTFLATAGQTTFSGIDSNSYVLNYSVGFCDVFLNGRRLTPTSDYTALDGSTIVLQSAASVNDVIFVASASTFDTADWVTNSVNYVYVATAGQTSFTGADSNSNILTYVNGTILVSVNGLQLPQSDYTATNGSTVILNSGVNAGDIVQIFSLRTMNPVNIFTQTQSDARYLQLTGGTVSGNITVGNSTVNTQITAGNIALNGSTLLIGNSTSNVVITGTTLTISNSSSNASFGTGPASINAIATNNFTIGTAAYFVANGNFGIGNTSPSYTFDITNSTLTSVTTSRCFSPANSAGYSATYFRTEKGNGYGGGLGGWINQGVNSGLVLTTQSAGTLTERLWIDNSGQVGIGNSTPTAKLQVQALGTGTYDKDFIIENANASGQAMLTFTYAGTVKSRIRTDYGGGLSITGMGEQYYGLDSSLSTGINHRFYANSTTPTAIILGNGNMGIGTTNPSFKTEIVCGYNNGIQVKDSTANVYGGWFTESTTMALVTRSNHGLRFGTNDTTRMLITNTGNVSIGTTSVTSSRLNVKGRRRIIAPSASSYEENRWFSHEGHYNISSVDNNSYSNVLMFRPYQNGTTTDPPGSSLWTRVGVEVRIGGHSSAIGSGDRWARYSLDYNGSGCSGSTTLQDLATTNAPRVTFSISGWQVILQVSGAGGSAGSLGGYCYVMLHFGGGEGSYAEAIEWSLTEYL